MTTPAATSTTFLMMYFLDRTLRPGSTRPASLCPSAVGHANARARHGPTRAASHARAAFARRRRERAGPDRSGPARSAPLALTSLQALRRLHEGVRPHVEPLPCVALLLREEHHVQLHGSLGSIRHVEVPHVVVQVEERAVRAHLAYGEDREGRRRPLENRLDVLPVDPLDPRSAPPELAQGVDEGAVLGPVRGDLLRVEPVERVVEPLPRRLERRVHRRLLLSSRLPHSFHASHLRSRV